MKKRTRISLAILACIILGIACVSLFYREISLDRLREEALLELEEKEGSYNENILVLKETSHRRAQLLAERLDAELRITKNGRFAALTLPEGVTVRDVYADRGNRDLLSELSLDEYVSIFEAPAEEIGDDSGLSFPNYTVTEPDYHLQSYLGYLNLGDTWQKCLAHNAEAPKITVAVIDTGIDTDHPEFSNAVGTSSIISPKSYNASEDKIVAAYDQDWSLIEDENGHGTAVAGVIAAQMNQKGMMGLAPFVELVVIKCDYVEEEDRFRSTADLVFAIYYAIEMQADVINMSFGSGTDIFSEAIRLAVESDIIPIAAAGNDASANPVYPAADPNTIGVGALDQNSWELASYSNYGDNSDLVAPGTVYTAATGGGYTVQNGTSMAAPMVSAAVAMYLYTHEYAQFDVLKADLMASSKDLGTLGEDSFYGYGCLDINAFVLEEKGTITWDFGTVEIKNSTQVFVRAHTVQTIPSPERDYLIFDDWYYDKAYTRPFVYEDYFTTEFVEDITLYAKWVNEDDNGASVYDYVILQDGTIEIVRYKGKRKYLEIPETIDGYTVTSIGAGSFEGNRRLRSVTFPKSLKIIKENAFLHVYNLEDIVFRGSALYEIGDRAFAECSSLNHVTIPDSVNIIGKKAFSLCSSLSALEISENSAISFMDVGAFEHTALTSFYVPKEANFDGSLVLGCSHMLSVTLHPENQNYVLRNATVMSADEKTLVYHPAGLRGEYTVADGVEKIGDMAFAYSSVSQCALPDSIRSIGNAAFTFASLRQCFIPDSVLELGENVFSYSAVEEVRLSEALSMIPKYTFAGSKLRSIHIPDGVITLEFAAFHNCRFLERVTFGDSSQLQKLADGDRGMEQGVFSSCVRLTEIRLPALAELGEFAFGHCAALKEITVPASVTRMGSAVFTQCVSLEKVTFDDLGSLKQLPVETFKDCVSLQSVTMPAAIESIGTQCFRGCLSLTTLDFGENSVLKTIGDHSFYGCYSLTHMQTPDSLETIGEFAYAFSGLCRVDIGSRLTEVGKGAFGGCDQLTVMEVSSENTAFASADNVLFSKDLSVLYCVPASRTGTYVLPQSVRVVSHYAFYYNGQLTGVVMAEGLEEILESAFYYCHRLKTVSVPDSVFTIGRQAFAYCDNLTEVSFGENSRLERLGFQTFVSCGLQSFRVPASVTSMAQYVFAGCKDLKAITFAAGSRLTYLSAYLFRGCNALETVVFEEGSALTTIQARAFSDMTSLKVLDLGNAAVETIHNYAFYECRNLQTFTLSEALNYIGRYAFYRCSSFTRLDIPAGVAYLGENAFYTGNSRLRVFFAADQLPAHAQADWDKGVAGYFLNVKDYVVTDQWEYAVTFRDTAAIVLYKGYDREVTVDVIDGLPVEKIGASAFEDKDNITKLTLSETVQEIGHGAFRDCDGLLTLELPASVTLIGDCAFERSKTVVTLPENSRLESIGQYAFKDNATVTLRLPDTVTVIEEGAFYNSALQTLTISEQSKLQRLGKLAFANSDLTAIHLPPELTDIGDQAFENTTALSELVFFESDKPLRIGNSALRNTALTTVTLPDRVNYIGEFALAGNTALLNIHVSEGNQSYTSRDGILFDAAGTSLVQYPAGRQGAYEIPSYVSVLQYGSFMGATGLTEVTFAEGCPVRTIGWKTFSDCTTLRKITIPDTVVSLDFYAFENCTALETVIFSGDSRLTGVYEGAFYHCVSLREIALPKTVTEIGDFAFYNCQSLTKIPLTVKSDLRRIGKSAFYQCENITEIPDYPQLSEIGEFAFGYSGVTSYTIPKQLKSIGRTSFHAAPIDYISVDKENLRYEDYNGLVYLSEATNPSDLFYLWIWPANRPYIMGEGLKEIYNWNLGFVDEWGIRHLEIADGVQDIMFYAFMDCRFLQTVSLPESLLTLNDSAFMNCSGLETIIIPSQIRTLGPSVFHGCSSLTQVSFAPSSKCTVIDYGAFAECESLESIALPGVLKTIGDRAFYGCEALWDISIPDRLKTVGDYAFAGCDSLIDLYFPLYFESMGDYAFEGVSGAALCFAYPDLPESMGKNWNGHAGYVSNVRRVIRDNNAVYAINRLGEAVLAAYYGEDTVLSIPTEVMEYSVTGIAPYACCDNTQLTSLTIPESITTVGNYAFYHCTGLEEVNFNARAMADLDYDNWVFGYAGHHGDGIRLTVGNQVTYIPAHLFNPYTHNSPKLISLDFEEVSQCYEIGYMAFAECSYLERVTIPESVNSISYTAFTGCVNVTEIYYNAVEAYNGLYNLNTFPDKSDKTKPIKVYIGPNVKIIPATFLRNSHMVTLEFAENSACTQIRQGTYEFHFEMQCIIDPPAALVSTAKAEADHAYLFSTVTTLLIPESVTVGSYIETKFPYREIVTYNGKTYIAYSRHVHTWNELDIDPISCLVNGFEGKMCIDCYLPVGNVMNCHRWETYEIPNTCEKYGFEGIRCADCGLVKGHRTDKHFFAYKETLPPTCTDWGKIVHACTQCGYEVFTNSDERNLGHSMTDWVVLVEPTCQTTGLKEKRCVRCETYTLTEVIPTSHSYNTDHVCELCGMDQPIIKTWDVSTAGDGSLMAYLYEIITNEKYRLEVRGAGDMKKWNSASRTPWYSYSSKITELIIGEGVTYLSNYAFSGFYALEYLDFRAVHMQDLTARNQVFYGAGKEYNSPGFHMNVGSEVTRIPANLFYLNSSTNYYVLQSITFEENSQCESIGAYAFYHAEKLVKVELPDSMRSIGEYAFSNASALETFLFNQGLQSIGNRAFRYAQLTGEVILPPSLTFLGESAFDGCDFEAVVMSDGLTTLADSTFYNCASLKEIRLPATLVSIGGSVFYNCKSLQSITLPSSVESIGRFAFYNCQSLGRVTFSSALKTIGEKAFMNCTALEELYFNAVSMDDLGQNKQVFSYAGTLSQGISVIVGREVTYIPAYLFNPYNNGNEAPLVTSLTFEEGSVCERIGEYAFADCHNLSTLELPHSLLEIGRNAFYGCSSLIELFLHEGLLTVGNYAFNGCKSLTRVYIPSTLGEMAQPLLRGCESLRCVYVASAEVARELSETYGYGDVVNFATTIAIRKDITNVSYAVRNNFPKVEEIIYNGETYVTYSKHDHQWQWKETLVEMIPCIKNGEDRYACDCLTETVVATSSHVLMTVEAQAPTCLDHGWETYVACEVCDYTTYAEIPALGHSYTAKITEPTCLEEGYTQYTCARCGHTYMDQVVSALGHDLIHHEGYEPDFCESQGYAPYDTCTRCDYTTFELLPARGHDYAVTVTPPTCTAKGYSDYLCNRCQKKYRGDYVDALGHIYGEWYTRVTPTCFRTGTDQRDCTGCSKYEMRSVPKVDHLYEVTKVVPNSCTSQGYTEYTCSYCRGKTRTYQEATGHAFGQNVEYVEATCTVQAHTISYCDNGCGRSQYEYFGEPLGHLMGDWEEIRAATCTRPGMIHRECLRCDNWWENQATDPLGHLYETTVVPPTCLEPGYTLHTCQRCEMSCTDQNTEATGHNMQEWKEVLAPTCTEEGYDIRSCTACSETETRQIAPLGHDLEMTTVPPTCTEAGRYEYQCSRCNHLKTENFGEPMGHSYGEWTTIQASTCTEHGREIMTCARCGYEISRELPYADHVFGQWQIQEVPSCTKEGKEYRLCQNCDHKETRSVDALGHDLHKEVSQATCVLPEQTTTTCSRCDFFTSEVTGDKLGHSYAMEILEPTCTTDGYEKSTCILCGDMRNIVLEKTGHFYSGYEVILPPSCNREGQELSVCQNCGDEKFRDLPKLNHEYSEWEILTPSTCTAEGVERSFCFNCGDEKFRDLPRLNHEYSEWEIRTESTCTAGGVEWSFCFNCEDEKFRDLPRLNHEYSEWEIRTESTCTAEGVERSFCFNCGDEKTRDLPKLNHEYSEWEIQTESTCTENGIRYQFCLLCGDVVTEKLPLSEHEYIIETINPTCTDAGYVCEVCIYCGKSNVLSSIPKLSHEYTRWIVEIEPTCIQKGIEKSTCVNCGHAQERYIDLLPHAYGDWELFIAPTCLSEGQYRASCVNCGRNKFDPIPKTDHDYVTKEILLSATCEEAGSELVACSYCHLTEIREISPKGHDDRLVTIPSTCTEGGYAFYECVNCGYSYDKSYIEPLGHSLGNWTVIKESTCISEGLKSRACERCDYTEEATIPLGDHLYRLAEVVAPTCTDQGYSHYECQICQSGYDREFTDPRGHSFGDWVTVNEGTCSVEGREKRSCLNCSSKEYRSTTFGDHRYMDTVISPTCTEGGYTIRECVICLSIVRDAYTNPTGHSMGDWITVKEPTCVAEGREERSCIHCDESESHALPVADHKYTDTVIPPTCTEQGYTSHTCGVCYHEYTDEFIPVIGHTFEDDRDAICNACGFVREVETEIETEIETETESQVTTETEPPAEPDTKEESTTDEEPGTRPADEPDTEREADTDTAEDTLPTEETDSSATTAPLKSSGCQGAVGSPYAILLLLAFFWVGLLLPKAGRAKKKD